MISYYELLGMIKEDKTPNKIKVHLTSTPKIYKKDDDTEEYCFYVLEDEKEVSENYQYYLIENYIESMMFDETIEIIEEKKIPEKIDLAWQNSFDEQVQQDCIKMIIKNINEIIDYLKSKGE